MMTQRHKTHAIPVAAMMIATLLGGCGLCVTSEASDLRIVNIDLAGAAAGGQPASDVQGLPQSYFLAGARHGFEHAASISGYTLAGTVENVYPGMTLACYVDEHHVEYAFLLGTGADPSRIRLRLNDVRFDALTPEGNIVYVGDGFEVYQHTPAIFRLDADGQRHPVDGRASLIGDAETSVTMSETSGPGTEDLNGARFNIIPADSGTDGPEYDFFMSRHEITNEQWARFLNDAQMNARNPRGENMFFDEHGNAWINPAMQPARDELFQIEKARIRYSPDRAAGDRYAQVMDDRGRYPYADHPAVGISWYGAVKYCNWLTLQSGRGPNEVCYREGTNTYDWAPVTSTNWANGFFTASEREAWLERKGFRLPMFRLYDPESGAYTNTFNEFLKAGSWNGTTNVPYGYGRSTYTTNDANAVDASMIYNWETLPVGYFNGQNRLVNGRALFNENAFGLHDLTGNVAEWLNDPARAGVPDARSLAGGSFQDRIRPLSQDVIVPPYASDGSGGFRATTTFMPDTRTQVNILFCFHSTTALPDELTERFGLTGVPAAPDAAPASPPVPAIPAADDTELADETASGDLQAGVEPPGIIYVKDPFAPEPEPPEPPPPEPPPEPPSPFPPTPFPPAPPPPTLPLYFLDVLSQNPGAGVGITLSTADYYGQGDGQSTFRRQYEFGATVTLTAPATADGNTFQHWLRNGVIFSTSLSVTVEMISNLRLTAVYTPPPPPTLFILDVYSQNPDSGVAITMSTADFHGQGNGDTSFRRQYEPGTTVTLTAPATKGNNVFQYWLRNGTPFLTSPSVTIQMLSDLQLTAVYLSPVPPVQRTLVVDSTPGRNVPINISRSDNNGLQNGNTLLSRRYDNNTQVTVTAPVTFNGEDFLGWLYNGVPYSTSPSVSLTMSSDITLTARYGQKIAAEERSLTVTSLNPDSGVPIAVSIPDLAGQQDGDTSFSRRYEYGKQITLTAPPVAPNGNTFVRWLRNGSAFSSDETITINLLFNYVFTALYESPPPEVVLTVRSSNPNSGVNIGISTADNNNQADGATMFTRQYDKGTEVTVTAPPVAPNGNEFRMWILNGAPLSTSASVTLTLLDNADLTAVYLPPTPVWMLTVLSQDPDSGVTIAVSEPDYRTGETDGETAFGRSYGNGTDVALTAPPVAPDGNVFAYWLVDGVRYSDRATISLLMTANRTVTAVYVEPSPVIRHVLTVESRNPNSSIVVSINPADVNGQQNGTTTFTRLYDHGQTVTLTARNPAFPGSSNLFRLWELDGTPVSTNEVLTVNMLRDTTVTAVYGPEPEQNDHTLTVRSSNPDSGVPILVSAPDINTGETSGSTAFDRLYSYATPVTVTAPPVAPDGSRFQHWLLNGNLFSTNSAITLSMLSDRTITAVYAPPPIERTLTVRSQVPDSGVNIQVGTLDNRGNQDGSTSFQRFYDDGAHVTLTAPPTAPNGRDVFVRWERDGIPVATGNTVEVALYQDVEMTAVYGPPSTFNLTVKSEYPNRNVPIGISTPDVLGRTDGNTLFVRTYNPGEPVTVTAPETSPSGTAFQYWLRNDVPFSYDRSVDIVMLADVELTAVYGPPEPINRSLVVRSSNPDSGVPITVTPKDIRNLGNGSTSLLRIYEDGETVTVTAPPIAGTNSFRQWVLNGLPISTNLSETIIMSQDHEIIAVYGPPVTPQDRVLTVDSRNPNSGVPITVSQPDLSGNTDGNTAFVRIYTYGDVTTLTAPEFAGTNNNEFLYWERNGVRYSDDRTVTVDMQSDVHMTAVYGTVPPMLTLTVESRNPDSGVVISVAPGDLNSETTGTTTFQRLYEPGQTVTLTAPATAEDRPFLHWLYGNVVIATNPVYNVSMTDNITMTAVYGDPVPVTDVTLTVRSRGPDGGIATLITATEDKNLNSSGTTEFQRLYDYGTLVTLTAPATSDGLNFDHWELGGVNYSSSQTISLTMFANTTITAVYVQPGVSPNAL